MSLKQIDIEPIGFEDKLDEMLDRLAAAVGMDPTKLSFGISLSHLKKAKEIAQPILGRVKNIRTTP